jgi:HK97 family phage portal protein
MHLMSSSLSRPMIAEDGSLFYKLGGNEILNRQLGGEIIVPERDCMHVRLNAPHGRTPWPLLGESPLASLVSELQMQGAIGASQSNFYANQARPSAVLSTDLILDRTQTEELRQRWNEQSQGLKAGNTPILTAGLKVAPWATSARDSQMVELSKVSDERIALAFRIPLQILGLGGGSPAGSTEILMQNWVATGLGFALNLVEESFGTFFRLRGGSDEYVEFSTEPLLRSAFATRMEGLARAVQGGIFSPNEARAMESLDAVPFGDEPRVQSQVVPLSAAGEIPTAPTAPASPAAPVPPTKIYPHAIRDAAASLRTRLRDQRIH